MSYDPRKQDASPEECVRQAEKILLDLPQVNVTSVQAATAQAWATLGLLKMAIEQRYKR